MSQRLTAICQSFFGSFCISFLVITLYGSIVMFLAPLPAAVVSIATFFVGFAFVFSEINLAPHNSTWKSTIGVMLAVSPILVSFMDISTAHFAR